MRETQVRSLGWENLLEKEMATPCQDSCLENPVDRGAWWATVHGLAKSRTGLSNYITKTLDWNTIFEKVMHSLTFDQMALRN